MAELEQFCILARTQKGRACAALIEQVIMQQFNNFPTVYCQFTTDQCFTSMQVLSNRKIFVFGELLALQSVLAVRNDEICLLSTPEVYIICWLSYSPFFCDTLQLDQSDHAKSLKTLELFAYGKWSDYRDTCGSSERTYINLNETQIIKLKQLTLVALAEQNKVPFDYR